MKPVIKYLICISVFLSTSTFSSLQAQDENSMIGQAAPSFTLNGLDGKSYSLSDYKGNYVVIHFAATWCTFCNAEAPNL